MNRRSPSFWTELFQAWWAGLDAPGAPLVELLQGEPAWLHVPPVQRRLLRRLIVTQADAQAGGLEQMRALVPIAPGVEDLEALRRLQGARVRQLLRLVELLHRHFGPEGADEAVALFQRGAGDTRRPRILHAFNEVFEDWPSWLAFAAFAESVARFQLGALAQAEFEPLARASQEACAEQDQNLSHAERGLERLLRRSARLGPDPRSAGGVDLPTVQKLVNQAYASCLDLFGSEVSSNAAEVFAAGLKGRWSEDDQDPGALSGSLIIPHLVGGELVDKPVPMPMALNESLRRGFIRCTERALARWNTALDEEGSSFRLRLPSARFHRQQGLYMPHHFDPDGTPIGMAEWEARAADWLPTHEDRAFLRGLMEPCPAPGQVAGWTTAASRPGGS